MKPAETEHKVIINLNNIYFKKLLQVEKKDRLAKIKSKVFEKDPFGAEEHEVIAIHKIFI